MDDAEWKSSSLVLTKYDARISAVSIGESIRGVRHKNIRPDLIICDDVEDLQTVKTRESRDKTYRWLMGDVIPAGDKDTKLVVIGNLLHEDSLMMRLKEDLQEGNMDGIYREYPLLDDANKSLWPDKFRNKDDIRALKQKTPDPASFMREYMLRIVPTHERVIHREWIQRYKIAPVGRKIQLSVTGVDLAISEKSSADYTAMVSAHVVGRGKDRIIYILPNPVNKRLSFPDTVATAKQVCDSIGSGTRTRLYIENVAYQQALIQQLQEEGYPAQGVAVHGSDKRERIALTGHLVQSGRILFPEQGAELLIEQLTNFGVEKHDDLADAFSLLVNAITAKPPRRARAFRNKPPGW